MAGTTSTTISVSFNANGGAQYYPSNQIAVPADTIATVTWQAYKAGTAPMPAFVKDSIKATGTDAIRVKFNIPASLGDPRYVASFVSTYDNSGSSAPISAQVQFNLVDPLVGQNPPVIDGGGSIRNKGTSIWVWSLVFLAAGLLAGILIGYTAAAGQSSGSPNPLIIAIAGLVVGFGSGLVYARSGIKRMS